MPATYFGSSAQPLYGVLDVPGGGHQGRLKKTGVVLLYPGMQEYIRAHWAYRTLAGAFAAKSYPVLRFDYRGTGDSAGEPEDTTLDACVEDACTAANELRDTAGVQHVMFVGMRLGAAVAEMAADRLPFVRSTFLWNPVIDGHSYLAQLEHMDAAIRLRLLHPLVRPAGELLGFRFPDHVRRSIASVDLLKRPGVRARRVDVFAETATREIDRLCEIYSSRGHTIHTHAIKDSSGLPAFPDAPLLAQQAIATLVARAQEVEP
jgi:pimeloyl-ACP methyl ester carboxylesterase